MGNDRISKRVFVAECAGSCSMGRLRKIWTDTVKDCLGFGCQASKENLA